MSRLIIIHLSSFNIFLDSMKCFNFIEFPFFIEPKPRDIIHITWKTNLNLPRNYLINKNPVINSLVPRSFRGNTFTYVIHSCMFFYISFHPFLHAVILIFFLQTKRGFSHPAFLLIKFSFNKSVFIEETGQSIGI